MDIMQTKRRIGDVLIDSELITQEQLDIALEVQKKEKKLLGEVLIDLNYVTEEQVIKTLEFALRIPHVDLSLITIEREILSLVPEATATKFQLIPIKKEGNVLTIAMVNPLDYDAIESIRIVTRMEVRPNVAMRAEIKTAIDKFYGQEGAEKAVSDLRDALSLSELTSLADLSESEVSNAPVVRLVNSIISHAINDGASDIHIEPSAKDLRIRFRVDGDLKEMMRSSMMAHSAVITRIKIIGGMNIAEKRIPQDGRVEYNLNDRSVDLRLSVLPTVYGEKVVMRILGSQSQALELDQLGFSQENLELFEKIIGSPNGVILVSGPTGSGKTTTLYTVLKKLNRPTVNIITVEDPVEYKLEGISQVQVNVGANLTFARGLRSILRQDPDIIMIGEIRDSETAEIAVRASITGHLVLSTIHTNDAASSVARLVDMGIEPFLVSSAVVGVVAQRLIKKICQRCKTSYRPDHTEKMLLKLTDEKQLMRGAGCPACNHTGYQGRMAIHEVLVCTKEIRELVDRKSSTDQLRQMAIRQGTKTLRENCIKLVLDGLTTTAELARVTYSIDY